ncbi:MAG: serine hydrolase domain-containing protein [Planctomycetota bacterium]
MKRSRIVALPLCALLVFSGAVSAEPPKPSCVPPPFMTRADIPGLGLAEVTSKAMEVHVYGDATFGKQCVTPETIFEAASLTKPVVAYLVMRLVERDVLALEDPLAELLPTLPLPDADPRSKQVTVRMALAHMSGLSGPDDRTLDFSEDPGTTFRYYPAGYRLVQRIVEHLEGESLEVLAQREVFEPLGMTSSTLVYRPEFADRLATRHNVLGETIKKDRDPDLPPNAAASLFTTTGDYGRFLQAMIQPKGLSEESVAAMLEPQIQVDKTDADVAWGIGWGLEPKRGTFFHWGDDGAAKCFTIGSRAADRALVYFTNSFYGMSIAGEMSQRLFPGDSPAVKWLNYRTWDSPFRLARRDILLAFAREGADAGMSMFNDYQARHEELDMSDLARWLVWLLDIRGLHAGRIKLLEWRIERDPDNVDLYLNLAPSQTAAGNHVSALETLRTARTKADTSLHPFIDGRLAWINGTVLAESNHREPLGFDNAVFIGSYGVRSIIDEDGALVYQREDGPKLKLSWMHNTTFAVEDNDSFRVRFLIEDGQAKKIILFDSSGNSGESPRDEPTP